VVGVVVTPTELAIMGCIVVVVLLLLWTEGSEP
jgi:hypothetical protein